MASEKRLLNPTAPEFRPSSQIRLSMLPPSPPPYPYYPPPVMLHYHHHHFHLHHHRHTLSKLSAPFYHYNFPKHDVMSPVADKGLSLITSPTSPLSPSTHLHFLHHSPTGPSPSPSPVRVNKPTRKDYVSTKQVRIRRSKLLWVKKNSAEEAPKEITAASPTPISIYPFGDSTSLMIRNIPVRLSRKELMELLDEHCRSENNNLSNSECFSMFDFLYLPVDFKRKGNLGYAFVNFTSWEGASRLYNSWKGKKWENCSYNTKKICQIHPAKFQGKQLKQHFSGSVFECETDEYLPVEIAPPRDGSNGELTKLLTIGRRVYGRRLGPDLTATVSDDS